MRKLQEYEIGLLHSAWFYIKLHFCRRGREGQCELRPDSFVVMHDDQDHPYLTMTPGGVKQDDKFECEARLYESNSHNEFALVKNTLTKFTRTSLQCISIQEREVLQQTKYDIKYEKYDIKYGINKLGSLINEISSGVKL